MHRDSAYYSLTISGMLFIHSQDENKPISLALIRIYLLCWKYSSAEDGTVLKEENLSYALLINLSPSLKFLVLLLKFNHRFPTRIVAVVGGWWIVLLALSSIKWHYATLSLFNIPAAF